MIIYNPHTHRIIEKRIKSAEEILGQINAKYCFITGSFLYKETYKDIDVFIITRSKKKFKVDNRKVNITIIDFNDMYSLFFRSVSKSCISKSIIPQRKLKVTIADYWHVINEAVPTLLNQRNKFHKDVRNLILYTEYFKKDQILDSCQLDKMVKGFKDYKEILEYIKENVSIIINNKVKRSYVKRFFYTQAGYFKDMKEYAAQRFLYNLAHLVTRGEYYG